MPKTKKNEFKPANTPPLTIQIFQMPCKVQQVGLTIG